MSNRSCLVDFRIHTAYFEVVNLKVGGADTVQVVVLSPFSVFFSPILLLHLWSFIMRGHFDSSTVMRSLFT